jgi:transcriptional regulator with XRE-family HTH domain
MDIKDIKRQNLIRLATKFRAEEPSKLARVLKVSTQHASQLLLGKSNVGKATISKLCKAWNVTEEDFIVIADSIIVPDLTIPGAHSSPETESKEIALLKEIIMQLSKRLDDQHDHIQTLVVANQQLREELRNDKQALDNRIDAVDLAGVNIGRELYETKSKMERAAKEGNIQLLGESQSETG